MPATVKPNNPAYDYVTNVGRLNQQAPSFIDYIRVIVSTHCAHRRRDAQAELASEAGYMPKWFCYRALYLSRWNNRSSVRVFAEKLQLNDLGPRHLAWKFILRLSRSSSKVKVMSSWKVYENVVGVTSSEGFLIKNEIMLHEKWIKKYRYASSIRKRVAQ